MSEKFARSAEQLAGLTTRAFGWSPEQFWTATPAELAAIFSAEVAPSGAPLSRREFDTLLERENHD